MLKHARHARPLAGSAAIALVLVMSGCATTETSGITASANPAQSAAAPAIGTTFPAGVTAALIVSGDTLFHESSCIACHGGEAKGTAVGPNLTDATWLNGDGSIGAITKIISEGVDDPKRFRSPMPAMGGADLSDDGLKAVAAYVWSISHK